MSIDKALKKKVSKEYGADFSDLRHERAIKQRAKAQGALRDKRRKAGLPTSGSAPSIW